MFDFKTVLMKLSRMGRKKLWFRKCLLMGAEIYYSSLKSLSNEDFANKLYSHFSNKKLNLVNPKTYNEKIWWLKFNYRNTLMPVCSDKYLVRQYVTDCGLCEILVPVLGVYDSFDDVPFSTFSEPVFIKCTKGSGCNVIFDPQKAFDFKTHKMLFKKKLNSDLTLFSREWNYGGTPNRVVCETVLRDADGNLPEDYKILCFGGVPKLVFFSQNVCADDGQHNVSGTRFVNVYDAETLQLMPIETSIPSNSSFVMKKPQNYERMIEIAGILSNPFPFCRVDLYNLGGRIYFGEITFFPSGGNDIIKPDEWSNRMGDWIEIDSINI